MSQKTYQGLGKISYGGSSLSSNANIVGSNFSVGKKQQNTNIKGIMLCTKILVMLIVFVAIFILIQYIPQLIPDKKEEYSVDGQWTCREVGEIEDVMVEAIYQEYKQEFTKDEVKRIISKCGLNQLDENATMGFYHDGTIEVRFAGIGVGVDMISKFVSFTYKEMEDNKLELKIEILNELEVSYLADYRVGEDWMIIDFFGQKLNFDRK